MNLNEMKEYFPGNQLPSRTVPANSMPNPPGPAIFPAVSNQQVDSNELLRQILKTLLAMNTPQKGIIRAAAVTNAGQTLDWSGIGPCAALFIRNKGPNSLWFAFDTNGPQVPATTGDGSFELQAQEAITINLVLYQKVGVICSGAGTATVHAIGFRNSSALMQGGIT